MTPHALLSLLIAEYPAQMLAGADSRPETVEAIRREMGLDQPLPVQYALWLSQIARGDLGRSLRSKVPITTLLAQRIEGDGGHYAFHFSIDAAGYLNFEWQGISISSFRGGQARR